MRPLPRRSKDIGEDLRKFAIFAGFCTLVFLTHTVDYDAHKGWSFVDYPFPWKISQVSKRQALSMLSAGQVKTYGLHWGQILMSRSDGKWYALNFSDNQDVVRQLGGQGVRYVGYYDYWH